MARRPPSTLRVADALAAAGFALEVLELPASTRTAPEAAAAVGCDVAQIVKSLVFRGARSGRAILVLASGANRVDEQRLAALAGEPVERADPEFVRAATGFAIGGVAPVGHPQPLEAFVDEDLMALPELWAAAGTPRSVFRLSPAQLVELTRGRVASVRHDART